MANRHRHVGGITLTEVLTVVIIIGILAALALPQFTATKERALSKEAKANLKLIEAAECIYRMELGFYYPYYSHPDNPQSGTDKINANLKLVLTETNWDYSIQTADTDHFTAYADRTDLDVPAPYKDCRYYMNQGMSEPDKDPAAAANCP